MESKKRNMLVQTIIFLVVVGVIIVSNTLSNDATQIIDMPQNNLLTESTPSIDHLMGTCPHNRLCTSPSCSLWLNTNHDGLCDRGEQ
jgi:hypothetical protein